MSRFSSASKFLAYVGCGPSIYHSETNQAVNSRISELGSQHLHYALYNAVFIVSQFESAFNPYYKRSENIESLSQYFGSCG
ncbi:transposase [Erysipelothrix larvae]|uniref:transposase n=1 Tax=Erysipelothrix larvae TaxID=1514105 RepID=UPI003AB0A0BE